MSTAFHTLNILYLLTFFCLFGAGRYSMIGYGLLLAYLILSFLFYPKQATYAFFSKKALPLYIYLLFLLLTGKMNFVYPTIQFIILVPLLILNFQISLIDKQPKLLKSQVYYNITLYFILLFFIIQYLIFIWENPMAARYLVSTNKDETVSIGGGFSMPYGLCLLIPFLFRVLKEYKMPYINKIVVVSFILISSFLIVRSSYTTAIVLLFVGIAYSFICNSSLHNQIYFFIFALVFAIPLFEIIPSVVSYINPDSYVLEDRIEEMRLILSDADNVTEGDFGSRIALAKSSLLTFLEYPIFGAGPVVGYNYSALWRAGVGSHCEWIDIFARYGLFALLIIRYFAANISSKAPVHKATLVMFVLLGFLNPVMLNQIIIVVFYLVPMTNYLLKSSNSTTVIRLKHS